MAWLANLDARATRWPLPFRWAYRGLKWYLIAAGVIVVTGMAITEWREGRVGLGTGVFTAVTLGIIKGIAMARHRAGE